MIASVTAWFAGSSIWWLIGGLLLISVIPFTLIVIMPTNKKLLAPGLEKKFSGHAPSLVALGQITYGAEYSEHTGFDYFSGHDLTKREETKWITIELCFEAMEFSLPIFSFLQQKCDNAFSCGNWRGIKNARLERGRNQ